MSTTTPSTARAWRELLPSVLALVLTSATVGALYLYSSAHLQHPTLTAFISITLLFSATLPFAIWRMARYMSRWAPLYFLTATIMVPALDGIIGMASRHIYLPAYVAAVVVTYLVARWARPLSRSSHIA